MAIRTTPRLSDSKRVTCRRHVVLPARLTWKDASGAVRFTSVTTRDLSDGGGTEPYYLQRATRRSRSADADAIGVAKGANWPAGGHVGLARVSFNGGPFVNVEDLRRVPRNSRGVSNA